MLSGVEKFGAYFKKKGWIGEEERREAGREVVEANYAAAEQREDEAGNAGGDGDGVVKKMKDRMGLGSVSKDKVWNLGEGGARLVVEVATAYAITKALLIPRIMFSVWATPAFARWTVVPVMARMGRLFGRGKKGGDGKTP